MRIFTDINFKKIIIILSINLSIFKILPTLHFLYRTIYLF